MNGEILYKILTRTNDYCYKHYLKHPDFVKIKEEKLADFVIQEVVDILHEKNLWTEDVKNAINWHFGKKPK